TEPTPESVEPPATSEPAITAAEQLSDLEPAASHAQEASTEPAEPSTEPTTPFDQPVATVSTLAADVATAKATTAKKATRPKKAAKTVPNAKTTREGSKTDKAIAMMKRPGGATLPELMATFGWQAHTVRGFVAGALTKKLGLTVASTKREGGERTYSIAS